VPLILDQSPVRALTAYIEHRHFERNHRGKGNLLLFPSMDVPPKCRTVYHRDRLGGFAQAHSLGGDPFGLDLTSQCKRIQDPYKNDASGSRMYFRRINGSR